MNNNQIKTDRNANFEGKTGKTIEDTFCSRVQFSTCHQALIFDQIGGKNPMNVSQKSIIGVSIFF